MTYAEAKEKLAKYGQEHVLQYFDELNEAENAELLEQVAATDFSVVAAVGNEELSKKGEITPLKAMELPEIEANRDMFYNKG